MTQSVCVVTETDASTRHEYTPIEVKFANEGAKKPNTLEAHFTINNLIRENFQIAYIQDIVSVEYLACVHNFQLSALDDRGYDLDGESGASVVIDESRFADISSGRFKGNYAIQFSETDQAIKVPSAKALTRIDLSKQFDIYIFFTPAPTQFLSGNDEPLLWSFHDDTGTERGLEIGITEQDTTDVWRGFVRANNGNNADVIRGDIQITLGVAAEPTLIRVFRDADEVIHLEVNGEPDGTLLKTGSLQPQSGSADLIFGNGKDNNDHYNGLIHQERTYIGTVLTQSQADTIRQSRPNLTIMKFAGLIWDVQDKESFKIARCDSHSKDLVKRKLSEDLFPDNGDEDIENNVFDISPTGPSFKDTLQDIVDATGAGFTVRAKDAFVTTTAVNTGFAIIGRLIAVGSFLEVVSILLLFSDTTFYVTPRKLLIIETDAGHDTDFVFDQDSDVTSYDITESEDNDTTKSNEVILTGIDGVTSARSFSAVVGTDSTLRKHITQLDTTTDLEILAIRLRQTRDTINTRFAVKINVLVNWVRFNHKVVIKNAVKNIDDTFIVAQIEHGYPISDTKIMVNEHVIDFFDITNNDISTQDGLVDNTI